MKIQILRIQSSLLLTVLICFVATSSRAQDISSGTSPMEPLTQTTRFGISPFFGYRFGGSVEDSDTGNEYDFKDAPAYGVFLDYAPKDYFGRFEFLWSRQDSSLDFQGNNGLGEVDVTIDEFLVGGEAEFGTDRFRGYVSAHIGATYFSSGDYGDDLEFGFSIGGGAKVFFTKNIYLRADLRAFGTLVEAQGSFIYYNGVTVATFSGSALWQGQASVGVGITF